MTRRWRNEFSWNYSRTYFWWHRTLTYRRVTNGDGSLIRTGSANSRRASPRPPDVVVRSGAQLAVILVSCAKVRVAHTPAERVQSMQPSVVAPRIPSPDAVAMETVSPDPHCLEERESGSPLTHGEGSRDRVSILSLHSRGVARESWRRRRCV